MRGSADPSSSHGPSSPDARRIRVAASVFVVVGLVVAASLGVNGCTPSAPSDNNPTNAPTTGLPTPTPTTVPTTSPTTVPTVAPTTGPTPTPTSAMVDGSYGPGTFTLNSQNCNPAFFGPSFNGTLVVSNNGTQVAITESQTRNSSGSVTNGFGNYVGSGVVGPNTASWIVFVQFGASTAVVTESLDLGSPRNCSGSYTSQTLVRTTP